jgi:carbamoyl-phosphate synthase large subunit
MNILITSAGQRVSLVRAFKTELKSINPSAKVFTTDMRPELSPACHVADGHFRVRRVTDPGYIDELLTICRKNDIRMVIPTIDTELTIMACSKQAFGDNDIHLIVSCSSFIEQCRDKRKTNVFFEQKNINTPALISKHNPIFPLFIKPYDGSLSNDTFIIKKEDELTDFHLTSEKLIFMEYVDKATHQEYTVDMYYGKDHQVKCIVPRKRIFVRAGEINKGVTCKNYIVSYLLEKLHTLEGVVGCITTQLFLNNDTNNIVAIEINPRFGGGYPLSYAAGANYPKWLIEEYFLNCKVQYTEDWEDHLLMLRYDDEILIHDYQN